MDNTSTTRNEFTTNTSQIRTLSETQQEWYSDNDGIHQIYNTPAETGKLLDAEQGKNPRHRGTCGIVSCVNVLRLAGRIDTTELEVLSYFSLADHPSKCWGGYRRKRIYGNGLNG